MDLVFVQHKLNVHQVARRSVRDSTDGTITERIHHGVHRVRFYVCLMRTYTFNG